MKNKATANQLSDLLLLKYKNEGLDNAARYARVLGHFIGILDFGLNYMTIDQIQKSINEDVAKLNQELNVK